MPSEGDMPKHLAKGSIAAVLDQRYSTTAQALDTLKTLQDPTIHLVNAGSFDAVPGTPARRDELKKHFRDDWLGESDATVPGKRTTGWWIGWQGGPEKVLREALIRSLEASLGIDRAQANQTPPPAPHRRLPIDFYWVCGLPRFEAYISWNAAQVTFILLTPGFTSSDPRMAQLIQVRDYPDDSANPNLAVRMQGNTGLIFVGQNIASSSAINVIMQPGVVINYMDAQYRGGVGAPL